MPYKKLISEVLAAHADQLLKEQGSGQSYSKLFPEDENLPSLLNLADQVKAALTPVTPPQTFKDQLQRDLMAAAHLKQLEQQKTERSLNWGQISLIISAIASAILALTGLFFLRRRQQHSRL